MGFKPFGMLVAVALSVAVSVSASGQEPVSYDVTFENAVHHEANISVTFSGIQNETLEVRMSRSSPGRYALHEFAKNVYSVSAVDGAGHDLEIVRPDPYQWDISGHDGTVTFRYTLFADRAGGTYSGIDLTHAHLNIPATFAWARGMGDRPIEVTFHVPEGSGWRAATQLQQVSEDPLKLTAPNLYYFMDSPTELSDFDLREWEFQGKTIRLAMHHLGSNADLDQYAEWAAAVVAEEQAVYGGLAPYDYGTYTFIADYLPWVSGDGMEHRNSTILSSTGDLATRGQQLLGTLAHEFFHSWNVERMRPATIEPFNFERANMSRELWFAEGFTSYYDDLSIRRAGITDDATYARGLSGGLNFVINAPGKDYFSLVEMSMQAPFVDAASAIDPTNRGNTFISYYTWGAAVGLGLDLTLRTMFPGLTLDDYMRAVWNAHGVTEIPYTVDDLQRILGELTGNRSFADDFFSRYIRGHEIVDYAALLAHAGMALEPANPGAATLGNASLRERNGQVFVSTATTVGDPLYQAGIDQSAELVSIDGRAVRSASDVGTAVSRHAPGDIVRIEFEQRGRRAVADVTLSADNTLRVDLFENTGQTVSNAQRAFREEWLKSNQ